MIVIEHPGGSITPKAGHTLGDPRDWLRVLFVRAEVVGSGKSPGARCSGEELFRETHVAVQWFENMLPGTNGMRTTNANWFAREKAPDEIWKEAVSRPVAAADDIAGTGGCNGNSVLR